MLATRRARRTRRRRRRKRRRRATTRRTIEELITSYDLALQFAAHSSKARKDCGVWDRSHVLTLAEGGLGCLVCACGEHERAWGWTVMSVYVCVCRDICMAVPT
eukprot:XP_001701392.1 predicted protein [Chlamydomonas reinhardtii]